MFHGKLKNKTKRTNKNTPECENVKQQPSVALLLLFFPPPEGSRGSQSPQCWSCFCWGISVWFFRAVNKTPMACLRPHINTTLSVCLNTASASCDPGRPINRFLLHVENNHFPIKDIKRSPKRNICFSRQEARKEIPKLTECQFKFQTS